jgi:hypothetical protein
MRLTASYDGQIHKMEVALKFLDNQIKSLTTSQHAPHQHDATQQKHAASKTQEKAPHESTKKSPLKQFFESLLKIYRDYIKPLFKGESKKVQQAANQYERALNEAAHASAHANPKALTSGLAKAAQSLGRATAQEGSPLAKEAATLTIAMATTAQDAAKGQSSGKKHEKTTQPNQAKDGKDGRIASPTLEQTKAQAAKFRATAQKPGLLGR